MSELNIKIDASKVKINQLDMNDNIKDDKILPETVIRETLDDRKNQKRLKKDIIIPAGTIMETAPLKTERFGNGHYDCAIGLTDNSCGFFNYCVDDDELDAWFEDVE